MKKGRPGNPGGLSKKPPLSKGRWPSEARPEGFRVKSFGSVPDLTGLLDEDGK
jgi:hypothetical protein